MVVSGNAEAIYLWTFEHVTAKRNRQSATPIRHGTSIDDSLNLMANLCKRDHTMGDRLLFERWFWVAILFYAYQVGILMSQASMYLKNVNWPLFLIIFLPPLVTLTPLFLPHLKAKHRAKWIFVLSVVTPLMLLPHIDPYPIVLVFAVLATPSIISRTLWNLSPFVQSLYLQSTSILVDVASLGIALAAITALTLTIIFLPKISQGIVRALFCIFILFVLLVLRSCAIDPITYGK